MMHNTTAENSEKWDVVSLFAHNYIRFKDNGGIMEVIVVYYF